jgi:cytochrome c
MDPKGQPTIIITLIVLVTITVAGCITGPLPEPEEPQVVPQDFLNKTNPLPSNVASLESGRKLYAENCENCHGLEGRGDGHQAMMYDPRPSNLHDPHVQEQSDGALFYWTTAGVKGTSMPPFRGLSADDRWNLVNYVRTFEVEENEVKGHVDENGHDPEETYDEEDVHQ